MRRVPYSRLVACIAMILAFASSWIQVPAGARATEGDDTLLQLDDDVQVNAAAFQASGGRCATIEFGSPDLPRAPGKERGFSTEGILEVPVALHIIYKETYSGGKWVRKGDLTSTKIEAQMRVLNNAYASTGVHFTLLSVDRTKNSAWYVMSMGSQAERDAKAALAIDPTHILNIYTAGLTNNILGWAYYPWSYPEANTLHGLVLLYSTVPGGSAAPYNQGDTATHEIGHYFGLFHTFQGGCAAPGDYVSDTPDEASPAYGCPTSRNTCASMGLDPTNNFMDYTDDSCMNMFTAGQLTRMRWAIANYKRNLGTPMPLAQAGGLRDEKPTPRFIDVHPNPFNPTTTIAFRLAEAGHVSLQVYDVTGRRVARLVDGNMAAGEHSQTFEGRGLSSGIYMAVLDVGGERLHQRLILAK